MSDTTISILALLDLFIGFLLWLYGNNYFDRFKWWKAALIKSFVYALFFGIGALGEGGGDPGFMLPYPVLPAAIVALTESKTYLFMQNALIPFGFWWLVFFIVYCLIYLLKQIRRGRRVDSL